jgi:diguanylate cyclase (GGDEF)-like protein
MSIPIRPFRHGTLENERRLARTDNLTGALNRRAFIEQLEFAVGLASRDGQPFALVYIDLDDFKQVNDVHGHTEGDRVLRTVAQTCADSVRRTDVVARLGGDEFALLLRGADRAGAEGVIAKSRQTLAAAFRSQRAGVTCSIGGVIFEGAPRSVEAAIQAADALMYEVKKQGKDSVALRTIEAAPGAAPTRA